MVINVIPGESFGNSFSDFCRPKDWVIEVASWFWCIGCDRIIFWGKWLEHLSKTNMVSIQSIRFLEHSLNGSHTYGQNVEAYLHGIVDGVILIFNFLNIWNECSSVENPPNNIQLFVFETSDQGHWMFLALWRTTARSTSKTPSTQIRTHDLCTLCTLQWFGRGNSWFKDLRWKTIAAHVDVELKADWHGSFCKLSPFTPTRYLASSLRPLPHSSTACRAPSMRLGTAGSDPLIFARREIRRIWTRSAEILLCNSCFKARIGLLLSSL